MKKAITSSITFFMCIVILAGQDNRIFISNPKDREIVFNPNSTPVWSYSFLYRSTTNFLTRAITLEDKLMSLIRQRQEREVKELMLMQGEQMANLNIKMADNVLEQAQLDAEKARNEVQLAKVRINNKEELIDRGQQQLEFNIKKQQEIRNRSFWNTVAKIGVVGAATMLTIYTGGAAAPLAGAALTWAISKGSAEAGSVIGDAFTQKANAKASDAMQNRTLEDKIREERRNLIELQGMLISAEINDGTAAIGIKKAKIGKEIAEKELEHRREQIDLYIRQKLEIPEELLIDETKKIIQTYIRYSILLAQLTERAYELSEVDDIDYIKPFEQYYGTSTGEWLIGEKILLDLNSIEYRRITQKKEKRNYSTYTLSLNARYPIELEELRERGVMQFDIMQQELDVAFPGTYAQMISNIDVQVIALAEPGGIKGQLSKEGLSWIKIPDYIAAENAADDWMQYVPSDYRLQLMHDIDETLVIPIQRNRPMNGDDEGLKGIFEGKGVCGVYTLELPQYSNDFDYNTIVDVIVTVNFSCYYDNTLKGLIETELCERETDLGFSGERELYFSSTDSSPDDWYAFHNPERDSLSMKRRILPLRIYKGDVPHGHLEPVVQYLRITAMNDEGLFVPLNFSVTNSKLNENLDFLEKDGTLKQSINFDKLTTWERDGFNYASYDGDTVFVKTNTTKFKHTLLKDTTRNVFKSKPYQVWLLRIEAIDNQQYAKYDPGYGWVFDEDKLKTLIDINWGFGYQYKTSICQSKPRVIAEMVRDSIRKGETAKGRILGLKDSTEVPYFYTSIGTKKTKIWQQENVERGWKVTKSGIGFEEDKVFRTNEYIDLIPFYNLLFKRGAQEAVEIAFDVKSGYGKYYFNPAFLSMTIQKNGNKRILKFQVDTSQMLDKSQKKLFSQVVSHTIHEDSIRLSFRYIDLSTKKSTSILDLRIKQGKTYKPIFLKPIAFTRWRERQHTNFTIKVHSGDKPPTEGNFILKDFKAVEFARF